MAFLIKEVAGTVKVTDLMSEKIAVLLIRKCW